MHIHSIINIRSVVLSFFIKEIKISLSSLHFDIFIYLSFYLFIYLCIYLRIYICIYISINLSIYTSNYLSIHQSIYPTPNSPPDWGPPPWSRCGACCRAPCPPGSRRCPAERSPWSGQDESDRLDRECNIENICIIYNIYIQHIFILSFLLSVNLSIYLFFLSLSLSLSLSLIIVSLSTCLFFSF